MARKLKEQIDYGNTPERMDPNLERKLASPENLYGKNPAMKKGVQDVQRLVSKRFQKVADKLREVTGIQDLSSRQVQGMVYQEMMRKLPNIMRIESENRDELIELAKEASLDEAEVPSDWYQIEATLGMPETDNFRMAPEDDEEEEDEDEKEELEFPSFDIEDLTDEEILELEKHKRNIVNALIQGAAKKGHYLFQKPEIKSRLDAIDPSLYGDYLGIMAINDFMYFSMEQMIEMMSQTGQGIAGKVELGDADDEDGGEEGEEKPDTKIMATGLIFPILCHEIIKGLEEAKGRHGLPSEPGMRQKVLGQTDILSNEPMQLRIGPEIVEKIRFALPEDIFDPEYKGLINWFHILLYQIPAQEFLELIGNAISEDSSKLGKAKSRFEEIVKEAKKMKEEFENYKEEEEIDSEEDDEDGLDDFLSGLGITRPK
jgi:hypothetical protein|tara:strand:+ start:4016 stop:5305 length:1290 start_codon:yes stop_codon:yes gene_type:complete